MQLAMTKAAGPIAIVAVSLLGAYGVANLLGLTPVRESAVAHVQANSEASEALARELRQVRQQVSGLQARVAQAEARTETLETATARGSEGSEQETSADGPEKPDEGHPARTPAERDELLIDVSRQLYSEKLREEPRDTAWAQSQESAIQTAVTTHYESRLVSVECGSTLCRTVVDHGTEEGRQPFILHLLGDTTFGTRCFFTRAGEGSGTQVFCAREGHDLPTIDPELLL